MPNITGWLFSPESAALATWIIAISLVISTTISVMAFLGMAHGIQIRFLKSQIESKLRLLESYASEARRKVEEYLSKLGASDPSSVIETAINYFAIEPVSIEPTDIIKRLERVLRTGEDRLESLVGSAIPSAPLHAKQIAFTGLLVANALNMMYMYVKHLLLTGVKNRNALLIAQLWMILPTILRIAKAYRDALPGILEGKPIGDSVGPYVAYKLMRKLGVSEVMEVVKDTVYAVSTYEGRKLVIVKARGPGSTVGKPGQAVEKLVTQIDSISAIITVDAALKFEGEPSGKIVEGAGVAMGDPGPEKIRIERIAVRKGIPLYAVVIKMSLEESIQTLNEVLARAADKAVERVLNLVKQYVPQGGTAIVVGVGNTVGVGQP
jgi:hypothetical protein